jgi:pimeloyl-ACP methyl ester carboxylesterase
LLGRALAATIGAARANGKAHGGPEWGAMTETSGRLTSDGVDLAWRRVAGAGPTVVWLGGFHSEMAATKAQALADWAAASGRDYLRFDYLGHGQSGGRFEDGTITRWRSDALAVIDGLTRGPLVLAGSSMGGWIACLAALARPERMKGMVLVAPAADFTERLLGPGLPAGALAAIERDGWWLRPSAYDPAGYPITRALLEDGARWSILGAEGVPISAPVRVLQGGEDPDVPWTHALELANALKGPDVVFTLIRDGDHRLSRPQDLARLVAAVEEVAA